MNVAEILANAVKVVEKAQEWSDEQKVQAASEIAARPEKERPSRTGVR